MRKRIWKEMQGVFMEGPLVELKNTIDDLIDYYGSEDTKIEEVEKWYPYESESTKYFALFKLVEETDEEMNNRISLENKRKEEQDQRDRAAYEQLKKKFGEV